VKNEEFEMPGILSSIFEDHESGHGGKDSGSLADRGSESGGGTETNVATHINPTIHVHDETSATWENPDGSEGGWSQTTDVTLTIDLEATAQVVTHYEQDNHDA
jgi:hypothetical protein